MSASMENMPQYLEDDICEIEATITSGFENVVKEDIEEKLGVLADIKRGRAAFKIPVKDVKKVLDLGGIDNCFVVMSRFPNVNFTNDELECMALLRKFVYSVDWKKGLLGWSQVFSFPLPIASTPEAIPDSVGEPTLSSRFHQPDYQAQKKQPKLSVVEKRRLRKQEAMEKRALERQQKVKDGRESPQEKVSTPGAGKDLSGENSNENSNSQEVSKNDSSEDPTNKRNPEDGGEPGQAPAPKKPKLTSHDPSKPAFRVTCNRNGQGHPFDSMGAAANFGGAVYNYFHWNVSMKQFDIEVILNIDGNDITVCLGLTKESLHRRYITSFGPTALKATHAYNMLKLCKLQPGDIVCDPMCGGGSIPIQCAVTWHDCVSLCGDIINNGLRRTQENINYVSKTHPICLDVVRWDVTKLPLRTATVDVCITDLPFGIRVGSKMHNWKLYPGALMEMARVSRVERGRACLLTADKKCINKAMSVTSKYWKCRNMIGLNMGGLAACVYVLHRTVEKYNAADAAEMLGTALEHARIKEKGSPDKTTETSEHARRNEKGSPEQSTDTK